MAAHLPDGHTALGHATLNVAEEELGITEDLGHNDGERIRDYWEGTGNGPPSNWCAAFTRFCIQTAAARLGMLPTIQGSVGAKATKDEFIAVGRWYPADVLRAHPHLLVEGMVPVWDRSDPTRPETHWWGHIGVCELPCRQDGSFGTIEGNSGPLGKSVSQMVRNVHDPRFLGAGVL